MVNIKRKPLATNIKSQKGCAIITPYCRKIFSAPKTKAIIITDIKEFHSLMNQNSKQPKHFWE